MSAESQTLKLSIQPRSDLKLHLEKVAVITPATDETLGGIKTDSENGIYLDEENRLVVDRTDTEARQAAAAAQDTADEALTAAQGAQATADNAQSSADTAQAKADQADEKADSATSAANQAQADATQAKADAQQAMTDADVAKGVATSAQAVAGEARDTANQAKVDANQAKTDASQALTTAQAADGKADNALSQATTATQTADEAKTLASTAQSTAEGAQSAAEGAATTATAAATAAAAAQTSATNAQTTADSAQAAATQAQATAEAAQQTADSKQDALVSGENIKTINDESILGAGNIETLTEIPAATDTELGGVKTNPSQNIDMNADGQLTVGGRLGQFPGGGLYYPTTITPEYMDANSLLISEATNLRVENVRVFALFGGTNITLKKSAAAGSTTYEVSNTFANRFTAACCLNGYATLNQQTAETTIVKVTSVKFANGNDISVYSGATEKNNNIIITTDESANPDGATTSIRVYGSMSFDTTAQIGLGVGTGGVTGQGKLFALGQGILSLQGNSLLVGNGMYNTQNRVGMIGFQHINTQQGAFLAGQGHDTTNGKISVAALGQWSDIGANTAFAVGNGKTNTNRSNIFEVTDDSGQTGLVLKSPNGTRWKLSVDDTGNLTTTAI